MTEPDVLVAGAGPTGLTLALQAHDHGAQIRLVDRRTEAFRPSRAMIVHPRTMEVLRPMGVTDALLARGDRHPTVTLHLGRRHLVPAGLADLDLPDTAFPHLLLVRQTDVEAVLLEAATERGLHVEWGTTLESCRLDAGRPVATLRGFGRATEIRPRFLVGADGSTSTVRGAAGIPFKGAPYPVDVVLADVHLSGDLAPGVAHAVAARDGLVFLFPLGERAPWRLLATVPGAPSTEPFGQVGPPVSRETLDVLVGRSGIGARITEVAWSSRVRLQHRVALRYRAGCVLLAGDAAHTFSPAGGQGMNTGIQDGANLGWKLALLAAADVSEGPLLASYELERMAVAQRILALTHMLFWVEAGTGAVASQVRGSLGPLAAPLLPLLLRRRRLIAQGIRVLSQLRWNYRRSPLSIEAGAQSRGWHRPGPGARPGDRLPDAAVVVERGNCRLHELTATAGVHILLQRDAQPLLPADDLVHVHRVLSWPGREVVIVRPDGYIGYAGAASGVADWLELLCLAPRGGT
jgi:2-polyprenyl-6-methoxyphenol hydroxylase-like FAD-dependent oxidoreductase